MQRINWEDYIQFQLKTFHVWNNNHQKTCNFMYFCWLFREYYHSSLVEDIQGNITIVDVLDTREDPLQPELTKIQY